MEDDFQNPIDKDKVTDTPGLLEYAHHVGSGVVKPVDIGKVKGRAMSAMVEQTNTQLVQIKEQIELLAKQAKKIQDRIVISREIYNAVTGFEPLIGHTYYLYERKNGEKLLSMVPPKQWGKSLPYKSFLASVKLLSDHTWEIQEE